MFPNWTGWKTAKIVLSAVSAMALAAYATPGLPTSWHNAETLVAGLCAVLSVGVITASGTSIGPNIVRADKETTK
jgi:hypothetical protein